MSSKPTFAEFVLESEIPENIDRNVSHIAHEKINPEPNIACEYMGKLNRDDDPGAIDYYLHLVTLQKWTSGEINGFGGQQEPDNGIEVNLATVDQPEPLNSFIKISYSAEDVDNTMTVKVNSASPNTKSNTTFKFTKGTAK